MGGMEKSTIQYSNLLSTIVNFVGIFASKGFYDNSDILKTRVKRYYPNRPISEKSYYLENLIKVLRIIRKEKITHIHYHHRIYILMVFFVKVFFPKIKIIYSHQNVFDDLLNKMIFADKIITLTKATKNDLPLWLQKKATIIPHGIFIPKNIASRTSLPQPTQIGYVGRFVEWKGIIGLLSDFAEAKKTVKQIKLTLVGDGPLLHKINTTISKLGIRDDVIIINSRHDLTTIYKKIDILVLPSKKLEGFGIVLIEAMSFGIPVITYNIPTYQDTVIDSYNGILAEDNIYDAILRSIKSESKYILLSKNAKLYSKKYDINKIILQYLEEIY